MREKTDWVFYGHHCNITGIKEPKYIGEAQENQIWVDAMKNEIDSLNGNNVWELVRVESQWGADGFLKWRQMLMDLLNDVKPALLPKDILRKS